jgi:uncharacterized membrane protein YphA (DoxX/SURF4 family)
MIATVASFVPAVLVAVLTAVFLVAGTINLSGRGAVKADFARWGFPAGFNLVCGGLELVGAALLISPLTRLWGLALLGAIMAGALFSLLRIGSRSHTSPRRWLFRSFLHSPLSLFPKV